MRQSDIQMRLGTPAVKIATSARECEGQGEADGGERERERERERKGAREERG